MASVTPSVTPTPADRAAATLGAGSLEHALAALREHGYAVIEDAVDRSDIAALGRRMLEDLPRLTGRADTPFNWNRGNLQQSPPRDARWLFPDLLFNPYACAISRALLGDEAINTHYTGNTAMPRSTWRQPVHVDYGHLWPAAAGDSPPHGLIVNAPMVDMDAGNGAIELWPGSHRIPVLGPGVFEHGVPPALLDRQRAQRPPLQPSVRAGSLLIRDLRLWHAGMPNPSDQARPMIAMIHFAGWWRPIEILDMPQAARPILDSPRLRVSARFVDAPVDHALLGQPYAFRG
jgi:ectoine hydroxylase-related dioxygenase (phytanoyl-CoA dioxygenase family)